MERKIGEIFEYNGEWYQCVRVICGCDGCSFRTKRPCDLMSECLAYNRSDGHSVIFKKLEKVGKPYTHYCPSGRIIYFQRYKLFYKLYSHNTEYIMCDFNEDGFVSIEIKQNKEDMEEKKLKPFDLQKAREGKPVCTRDGRKARIICFDSKYDSQRPIIALITDNNRELLYEYTIEGKDDFALRTYSGTSDLMMFPEKKEGWVNVYNNPTTHNIYTSADVFESKEIAEEQGTQRNRIATCKITWEE